MADAPRTPMLAVCRECCHVWPAIWMPCPITRLAEAAQTRGCPWCGCTTPDKIVMATKGAGDLDRYAAWLETELTRARKDVADG
jgi:hypothetical protein